MTIKLVQGDTGPLLTFTLRDKSTGSPIDLVGMVSAVLNVYPNGSTTILESIPLVLLGDGSTGRLEQAVHWNATTATPGAYTAELQYVMPISESITVFDTLSIYVRNHP